MAVLSLKDNEYDIIIVGGGAAGLAAAITIGDLAPDKEVLLLEKNEEAGKKILATGNGKCNISNVRFNAHERIERFFNDMGILFREEERGRVYPYSEQARSVRDILMNKALSSGVKLSLKKEVCDIRKTTDGFSVITKDDNTFSCKKLLVTTGGKAGIQYGSDGIGVKLVRQLGQPTIPLRPALVPMVYADELLPAIKKLKGVRAKADVTLIKDNQKRETQKGEVQFTDYGLSGICIFDLTLQMDSPPHDSKPNWTVSIDLLPDMSRSELLDFLLSQQSIDLRGILNSKIVDYLYEKYKVFNLDEDEIVELIKDFRVPVSGTRGWKDAQVTVGGVDVAEINSTTMESKVIDDLYFAGEILDFAGRCGGDNLAWAWSTGMDAGKHMVQDA